MTKMNNLLHKQLTDQSFSQKLINEFNEIQEYITSKI